MTLDAHRWRAPVAIAHRGSRVLWPENTMVSFAGAMGLGYRHLETDLHITSDGVLVCFHDDTVDRTTDGRGRVEDLSLTQVKGLDAGYRHQTRHGFPFRGKGITVPTLEEVMASSPDVSVIVDLKSAGLAGPLVEMIEALEIHDRLIVGSFSDRRLAEFRGLTNGRVATSTGPRAARAFVVASRIGFGVNGPASALQLPTHRSGVRVVNRRLVDRAHRLGMQIHVWTVNTRSEMTRLLDMGVDGIITDRPDLLRTIMEERGEWAA